MAAMDIMAVNRIAAEAIEQAKNQFTVPDGNKESEDSFSSLLSAAMGLVNETNNLTKEAEAEGLNFAMGYSNNAHDLAIAQQKAVQAIQYTVAVKNKLMEAYREIMNIQI